MDEQRTQAYLNLINQLLSCNEGYEPRILQENQELLDQNLIEIMIAVAQQYEEEGRENEAQRLAEVLGLLENENIVTTNTYDDYLNFLMETLQKVAENPNPELVYPFLEQNLNKLDSKFQKILDVWTKNKLLSVEAEEARYIADVIINFSNLIQQFPLENIAINKEIAIIGYKIALTIFNFEALPYKWAITQNNLGNAYLYRIKGNTLENLEKAVCSYKKALKVFTIKAFPYEWAITQNHLTAVYTSRKRGKKANNLEKAILASKKALKILNLQVVPQDWASTQNNLGLAYSKRIRGDKSENLEKAICSYKKALKVFTIQAFPQDWANTQNNLAIAYGERIKGDKLENLEKAIFSCQQALKIYTLEAFPYEWARTQNNLAIAYGERIKGDKLENLEKAIFLCQQALKIYTIEALPYEWSMIQNTLANAYFYRIKGDKSENLEQAISFYEQALKVYTYEALPYEWARTQHNLANTYLFRMRGDKSENLNKAILSYQQVLRVYTFEAFSYEWARTQHHLATAYTERIKESEDIEKAISFYEQALKVFTIKAFPQDWARTQNNLANAYLCRMREDKLENLEKAISASQQALKVYTYEALPYEWATTQNNLAHAYYFRIRGDKAENLENAITSYHHALRIRTRENDPLNCLQTARNLGNLHYEQKQWQSATEAYHTAIEAVENARLEALNPQSRQEVLSNAIDVFHRIVQGHLNLNQPEKALEYIERSKGRNLVELMTQKELKPQGVSQETIDKLAQLKQQVVNEQIRLQHQSINQNLMRSNNLNPYVQDHSYLKEYQQELDTFITKNITPYNPTFNLTQKVKPIPFEDIKSLTDDSTCLLQWYITGEKILAFIVSANETVKLWQSSEDDRKQLFETLDNYLNFYYSKTGKKEWINQLPNLLQTFANTLHINEIISLIPETCECLIIIPHWFLHILPIHAFPIDNNYILQDQYDIQYAPSCQLLQITKQRPLNELINLFAIQNPTQDRPFVDFGMEVIRNFFQPNDYVLSGNKVTKTNLLLDKKLTNSNCFHFFGHGEYNPQSPLESALILANNESLNLSEIFDIKLDKCRLVILSACETGIIDINSISDEYIGLPSGFIFAGSPNIISSLWVVDSVSTAFLMIELYENITQQSKQNNIDITTALKDAQNKLRRMTYERFNQRLNQYQSQLDTIKSQLSRVEKRKFQAVLNYRQKQSYPFSHPFDWAAFVSIGR